MFDLIINLIDQRIPISQLLTALLEVGAFGDVLEEHGVNVEGVVGTCQRNEAFRMACLMIRGKVCEG